MDIDAIKTSYQFNKMLDEHDSGGYFSDAVKEAFKAIEDLSYQEKRTFFTEHFNEVFALAEALQNREGENFVDLSVEGLGVIAFDATRTTAEEVDEEGCVGFRSLRVEAYTFVSVATETEAKPPRLWQRGDGYLNLDDDGNIDDTDRENIDQAILWILDFKETLGIATQALEASHSISRNLGKTATSL